jgi:hypothetical protein
MKQTIAAITLAGASLIGGCETTPTPQAESGALECPLIDSAAARELRRIDRSFRECSEIEGDELIRLRNRYTEADTAAELATFQCLQGILARRIDTCLLGVDAE